MYYFSYEEPVFRPPSEARSLILQITIGCSQNQCKFCGMYKMKQFRVRPVADIAAEIGAIPALHRQHYQRIFLADGDALVYPQAGLIDILELVNDAFPNLSRVAAYASPKSLTTKTVTELMELKEKKLRILYFGLESGDAVTLRNVDKGYSPEQMLELCQNAKNAGMKLSITAILGLAGQQRTAEHALATAEWINQLSPEYFSLLTMFKRHNDDYFDQIEPLTNGEIIEEALAIVKQLHPKKCILRSNHVSNILNLAGS
ncbi:MAG: radical SAM protein, partial [Deltaproteobacteria bacterium]|nr:radical SAM protein [Deltaproteobacteria bacterium]